MNRLRTPARDAVLDAALQKHPLSSNKQLARVVYASNKEMFPTLDSCYSAIRLRRGAKGVIARKSSLAKYKTPSSIPPLPESKASPWATVKLPPGETLVLSDAHFPYHDIPAVEAALATGERDKVDSILLNGDTLDFYSISRFETNPKERDLRGELESVQQFMRHLRARFPKASILFKQGNHDERWDSYVWRKAPELFDLPSMKLEAVLGLQDFGVRMLPRRCRVVAHKLDILHGHELDKGFVAPVNPARGAFLRTAECVLVGHYHRTSEHIERSSRGRLTSCFSAGCLAGLWPDYSVANKWNHGFARVTVDGGGFTVRNLRIMDGRVL